MLSKKNRPTCIALRKFYYGTLPVPFPLQDTICVLDFPENQTSIFYELSPIFQQRIRKKDLLQKKKKNAY